MWYSAKWLSIGKPRSQNHITFGQFKTATHVFHWLKHTFSSRKVPITIANMRVSHSEFISVFPENIHSYVTTTNLLTLPIYYKLQNAQWIEEIQYAQNILVFFLMCDLKVTVKLYRAACRLMPTHISSQIRTINARTVCLMSILLYNNI